MTSLFKQLEALSVKPNKAYSRFRRSYASKEHYTRVLVCESWEFMLAQDATIVECEVLFRSCLSDPSQAAVAAMAARSAMAAAESSDSAEVEMADTTTGPSWQDKEIEFMVESEFLECQRMLQLFLDLSTPWLLHEQCQNLIDFLIYQYELASRFGEMLLLAILPIHESAYFVKVAEMVTLPDGSEFSYYIPAKAPAAKSAEIGNAEAPKVRVGVSRDTIVAGTVRSFSNYRRISETVERLALVRQRAGTYVPLYTVLSVAFIEQNRGKIGDSEIRLLLNNVFSGLKRPDASAYYSAQLCTLTVLFCTVTVTISVQRTVVTCMLNPLLSELRDSDSPPFDIRMKLKDAILVLLGMLHQQKERLDSLPINTTQLLLAVLHKFPALVNVFRGIGGSGEALDFSRLCKVLTVSVVKASKPSAKAAQSAESANDVDLIKCAIDFFMRLDYSILYVRVMMYTLIDDLVMFSLSTCRQGEALFQWDPATMKGSLNTHHSDTLSVYGRFFSELHAASPAVFDDVLQRTLQSTNRSPEMLSVFLLICHSVSGGCPLHFTVLVHKCSGKKLPTGPSELPKSVAAHNLGSTVVLYTDPNLPSKSRAQLYGMLSAIVNADVLSTVDHGALCEFIRVSVSDPQCIPLLYRDTRLLSLLPSSAVTRVLISQIGCLLTGSGLSFSAPASLKVKPKSHMPAMEPFYSKCFEVLSRDSPASRQLLFALSLFTDFYGRAAIDERENMQQASYHFMRLMHVISRNAKHAKSAKKSGKNSDASDSAASEHSEDATSTSGSSDAHNAGSSDTVSDTNDSAAIPAPSLKTICDHYFGDSHSHEGRDYCSTMSLLLGILDSMVQLSTATTYVNTSSGEDTSTIGATPISFGNDTVWFNEWLVCYGLYESSELLSSALKPSSSSSGNSKAENNAEEASETDASSKSNKGSHPDITLSAEELRQLFSLSEVVLCYAIKLHRGSVLLGELTNFFAQCHFKMLTLCSISVPRSVDVRGESNPAECNDFPDAAFDRDALLLHTMLTLSSEEFTAHFKEALSTAPKSVLSRVHLWLKHYFEFSHLARSMEHRPGLHLDLYGSILESQVEVNRSKMTVAFRGVIGDVFALGPSMVAEMLDGKTDLIWPPQETSEPQEDDVGTLHIPYVSLSELDGIMKMYGRCMDVLSHVVCESLRVKAFNNSCLMIDVLVNSLAFLVDKEHLVRRPAVLMLSRVMQCYVDTPSKSHARFVTVCGYHLCPEFNIAIAGLEYPFKGFDKTLRKLCSGLLENNAPFPNVMFVNQLFSHCSGEPVILSLLLYGCVFSGTSLQFNVDVLRRIGANLSSDHGADVFCTALAGLLQFVKDYKISSPTDLSVLRRFLLCFASSASSVAVSGLHGKAGCFASTVCPAVLDNLTTMMQGLSGMGEPLQTDIDIIRKVCSFCAGVCMSTLSEGAFWSVKGEVQTRLLESFDRAFGTMEASARLLCLRYLTSDYNKSKNAVKSVVSIIPRLQSCSNHLQELFVMGIVDNSPADLLPEVFNAVLQQEKSSKGWFNVSFLLLQRYLTRADLKSDAAVSLITKGSSSLLDGIAKAHKSGSPQTAAGSTEESSLSELGHVAVFINQLYLRLQQKSGSLDVKSMHKLHADVCRCLRALCKRCGAATFEFVRPFLCKMCIIEYTLSSSSGDEADKGDNTTDTESQPLKPSVTAKAVTKSCAAVCHLLMQVFESDRSATATLQFAELCTVFPSSTSAAYNQGLGDMSRNATRGSSGPDMSFAYDEWLCYALYSCICICRLDASSPAVARCVELLKSSSDPVGVLSTLVLTAVSASAEEEPRFPSWIPHLDVRSLGMGKHLDSSSKLGLACDMQSFVHQIVVQSADLFEVAIDALSFNDLKSPEHRRYQSVSLLLQSLSISMVCFKDVGSDATLSGVNKKKKGLMGVCAPSTDASDSADPSSTSILKKSGEIMRLVYAANPEENYPRLALGALSFFWCKDRMSSPSDNFWNAACGIDFMKQPWVCDYVSVALGYISKSIGNKFGLSTKPPMSSAAAAYSKELSIVLARLARVLSDFLMATDACILSKKHDDALQLLIGRSRKSAWRTLIGLCYGLSGDWVLHGFALARSRVELLLQLKSFNHYVVLDFVNAVKLCVRLVACGEVKDESFDIQLVHSLSSSLAKLTAQLVERYLDNASLSACVLGLMLLLRRRFGKATGDELLEAIMNLLVFFSSPTPVEERFALPAEEELLTDRKLASVCSDIFEDLLQCNSDKVSKAIVAASDKVILSKATPVRMATLLSFYASVSCKYYDMLRLVLGLDFTQVLSAMRDGSRLMSLVSISLHYNRIKSRYVGDLDRLYFLNVNLLSEFESASASVSNRKARKAAKNSAPAESDVAAGRESLSGDVIATPSEEKEANNSDSSALDPTSASGLMSAYLDDATGPPRLELSCRLFSEPKLEFGSETGVKSFEDCAIVFALQYFSKIRSSDLVEVLAKHIGALKKSDTSADGAASPLPKDGTRLLLRMIVAALSEYGSLGATQFVLPRVYQHLNTVLDSTIEELCAPTSKAGKPKSSKSHANSGASWKVFVNGVLALRAIRTCVETWDSKQASVPDMCLNVWLPTLGKALGVFDFLSGTWEMQEWERALEGTFLHLLFACSGDAERIEQVLSGDLVSRSEVCKCRVLNILLSLWGKANFHLGGSVVNIMPVLGELADDQSEEVQRLSELLNERIQSFLNM
ncbi:U3 small nucleolar RNA-associated protein 10, putative [Babesia ovata]|uniref:U3 small nucleolar RNA-associated protein 10, putative n=1 Tax=Babesia ovata TaxID=189622 RepID=A0A2H6KG08_9APIC|nr:U3 small nucleolar RNA-associated protein 10, putative [Babesia ovata]GBE61933.1 U3 small nucleolar RNA-associated protein 10, putative [Babesia ovata]